MDGNQNPEGNTNTQTPVDSQPTPMPTPETAVAQESAPKVEPEVKSNFELNETTILASLSYLGPLVVIPYLIKKENPFVMFHIKQGLLLLIPYLVLWLVGGMMYSLMGVFDIIKLILVVFSVIGVVNATQSKEKELPLIGKFASKINI